MFSRSMLKLRDAAGWIPPVLLLAGLMFGSDPASGVELKLGKTGSLLRERVETPNLASGPVSAPAADPVSTVVPAQPPGAIANLPPWQEKVRRVWSHLLSPANQRRTQVPGNATLDQVVQGPPAGTLEVKGIGTKDGVAATDGPVKIEIFMPTRQPATMQVRLFGEDGQEIYFQGRSLLTWTRPDDKAYAPVYYQGKADPASMYENGPGDFSPKSDLSYEFDIKQGQRLSFETRGNALPESYLRVSGPAF